MHFRIFGRDCVGNLLEDGRLTGLWRRDDQAALSAADRCDQVDQAGSQRDPVDFEIEAAVGKDRRELFESGAEADLFRVETVDRFDF